MGYTFQLVGCSNLDFKRDVPRETRKILYNKHGSEGSDGTGYANTYVFYFRLRDNVFALKTDSSKSAGFGHDGSWLGRTVDSFFSAMRRYAYSNGLSYTCPVACGTTAAIPWDQCATYSREFEAILEQLASRSTRAAGVAPTAGTAKSTAAGKPMDVPDASANGSGDDDESSDNDSCLGKDEFERSMHHKWAKAVAEAFALGADGGMVYVETM